MADNYKFVITGSDKTRAMFKGLKANLGAVRGALNSTQLKVAGLAGVAGLGALVKSSLSTQDTLAKMSDRLNVSTQDLAAFRHMTVLNGESAESFDRSLEKMVRGVGEAARGFGSAKRALDELGLDGAELATKDAGVQFRTVAEAIRQVDDRARQASLAADIFGRAGIRLMNTINQGKASFEQAQDEVQRFGVALSRVDAAKMEMANDAMFRTSQITAGLGNQLTIKLAPIIEEIATQFSATAQQAGGMGALVESAFKKGVSVAGVFADGVHGLKIVFQGLQIVAQGFAAAVLGAFNVIVTRAVDFANGIKNLVLAPLRLALKGASVFSSEAAAALDSLNQSTADFKPPAALGEAFDTMVTGLRDSRTELQALLMTELPSNVLKGKVDQILAAAEVRAQEIAAKAQQSAGLAPAANDDGGNGNGVGADGLKDREREQLAAKLETLKFSWLSELEQLQVKQDQEMAILDSAFASKLIKHDEYERSLAALEGKHAKQRAKFDEQSNKSRWQSLSGAFSTMLSVADGGSKKLFKIQKLASLAQAAASLPSAVIDSYKNAGGYPWGIPAAAAMAAAGAAQIAQIKSANFSGGGGGSVPGIGGGSATAAPPSTGASLAGINQFANNGAAAPGQVVNLNIAGDLIGDSAQTIASQITTLIAEQDLVIIPNGSRQAQELAG